MTTKNGCLNELIIADLNCWHHRWVELILQVFVQLFLITVTTLLKGTVETNESSIKYL